MLLPDCIAIAPVSHDAEMRWPEFPYRLLILPDGITASALFDRPRTVAVFLVDPDNAVEVLNDPALACYLERRIPIVVNAARAADLRPFLRREAMFRARGYAVEVVA